MKATAEKLDKLINKFETLLYDVSKKEFKRKHEGKWSKKEELGHCIDSAENNIRRFIVAQYEDEPIIVYKQDYWVKANNYQNFKIKELIRLWYFLNRQIVSILNNMPSDKAQATCRSENVHTIEWLAEDYVKHMRHHLHHILNLEPIPYP